MKIKFANYFRLLASLIVLLACQQLFATTYIVGTCKAGHQFPSIGAALAAMPAPATVLVCPGTYHEQVNITRPVDLRGISTDSSSQVVIAPPTAGIIVGILANNATDNDGNAFHALLAVTNVTGSVNVSGITVDGTGGVVINNDGLKHFGTGIFYLNSSGTINHVTVQNLLTGNEPSGIWVQGGESNPSVTVENSVVQNVGQLGIVPLGIVSGEPFTFSLPAPFTATIKGNFVNAGPSNLATTSILVWSCDVCTTMVTGNTVLGGGSGIRIGSGLGSVTANKLLNNGGGISVVGGAYSVTSNKVFNSTAFGIGFSTNQTLVENNTIIGGPIGIDFVCTTDGNVRSNLIEDVVTGLNKVPSGVNSANTYINVHTIKTGC
jgi:hypothetical protein